MLQDLAPLNLNLQSLFLSNSDCCLFAASEVNLLFGYKTGVL